MAFTPSSSDIELASTRFRVIFNRGWDNVEVISEDYCEMITSEGSKEVYFVPDALGPMRQWIGDRVIEDLDRQKFELSNLTFEKSVAVRVEDFEDDTLGGYQAQFSMLGASARQHPDILFTTALEQGFSKTGYDGVTFFSTAHPTAVSGTTWSNKGTAALDADAFEAGVQAMRKVKNSAGQPFDPLGLGGELGLMVPPELEATARRIVERKLVDAGEDNVNFGRAKVKVNSRLSSTTGWYLLLGKGPVRPFVRQTRRKPKLVVINSATSDDVFYKNRIVWGVDGRWNVGRALPQFAYGSTGLS